jgi:hypothetical protein
LTNRTSSSSITDRGFNPINLTLLLLLEPLSLFLPPLLPFVAVLLLQILLPCFMLLPFPGTGLTPASSSISF